MKRSYFLALAALTLCGGLHAQDIYKVESLSGSDLNGTARFVGMGGAMSALGADISTMGSNPAAIGMFRRSDVAFTASATIQPNGTTMADIEKARGSFDQAGFVYACKLGKSGLKFFNMGFNYQKRRNFKNYIANLGVPTLDGMSQSWQMMDLAHYNGRPLDLHPESPDCDYTTPLTLIGYDTQMISPIYNDKNELTGYSPSFANSYSYRRAQWGGIRQYDFNLSMNWEDQVYAGLTIGVYDVDMHTETDYSEILVDNKGTKDLYRMTNSEILEGTGVDVKLGIILRPIEESPFRLGFSVSTPIFYDLSQRSYLYMCSPYDYTDKEGTTHPYTEADGETGIDYRIRSPWRFNLSMGTTVGNYLALGAEYEVAHSKGAQVRYPEYDDYDGYTTQSKRDRALDHEIDACLKAVHTFRIGAEARLARGVFGRIGYNYVSAPFKKNAFLNLFTDSPSYAYSTNTDYVNLGAINRITAGLGFRGKHFYADATYQYQAQQGDVYAFHVAKDDGITNRLQAQKVDLNRHNVMFTIGYKF